jgi:hypothetical protein
MARKKLTDEEKRRKELIKELMRETPQRNGQYLNDIMKEFITEMVNGSLEGELDIALRGVAPPGGEVAGLSRRVA